MDWIDEYARVLGRETDVGIGEEERRALLKLARDVAHRTERVFAPLSTYLAGRYVADRIRAGFDAEEAVREAFSIAQELLPAAPQER